MMLGITAKTQCTMQVYLQQDDYLQITGVLSEIKLTA